MNHARHFGATVCGNVSNYLDIFFFSRLHDVLHQVDRSAALENIDYVWSLQTLTYNTSPEWKKVRLKCKQLFCHLLLCLVSGFDVT